MDASVETRPMTDDERRLAELGYRQDLSRRMSGFQNFALSFTIISILSGALTLYGYGMNYGGPMQQAWGWPIVSVFVIIVALSMAELASAFPTAGGLYWWASRLGSPAWGWFTGWFNLIGQVAITAGIDYGAAIFTTTLLNLVFGYNNDNHHIMYAYAAILVLHATMNIFSVRLVGVLNHVSAYWHVVGVAVIALVLIIFPDHHQSVSFVFTKTVNNSGLGGVGIFFVFLLGFLQAQYTYTGYDASAHLSEETHEASRSAAKGVVNSVLVSAIAGWVLILALTFAIKDLGKVTGAGTFAVTEVLDQALGKTGAELMLFIAVVGQLFCGMSAITSASRMLFAFSRDRAVPGHRIWSHLNARHVPSNAVILIAFLAFLLALPAWSSSSFFVYAAVTSVATIGLYIAYILPIILRFKAGDKFEPGPWSLGRWYKPLNIIAMIWVAFISILFILPPTDSAIPWNSSWDYKTANYAPVALGVVILAVGIWWLVSARHWFKGPTRTIEMDELGRVVGEHPVPGAEPPAAGAPA
ncbi:MAG TPA: amino acid permease [Thermoleophilaceae bacterium]|nr:amino acid permease [Thermoleophilaceae bacterium]